MLLGTYAVKIASGRRVFVPAQLRKDLGENFIIAQWYEECLVLIGVDSWMALYKRLTGGKKVLISPIRDTERFILGSAFGINLDDQGRIVIPESLVEFANLKDEICFIGVGDRVEIWDRETWEAKKKLLAKESANLLERLSKDEK